MGSYALKLAEAFDSTEITALQTRILHHLGMSILHRTAGSHFVSYDGPDKALWRQRALALLASENQSVTDSIKAIL